MGANATGEQREGGRGGRPGGSGNPLISVHPGNAVAVNLANRGRDVLSARVLRGHEWQSASARVAPPRPVVEGSKNGRHRHASNPPAAGRGRMWVQFWSPAWPGPVRIPAA